MIAVFLLLLFIAATGLSFLLSKGKPGAVFLMAPLVFLINRNFADAFYFRYLSHTLLFAFVLLLVADWLFMRYLTTKKWQLLIPGVICQIFSFGVYQLMANIQISLLLSIFVLSFFDEEHKEERHKARYILSYPIYFLAALLPYELISKLFFSGSTYLDEQVAWGQEPIGDVLYDVCYAIFRYLFAPRAMLDKTYQAVAILLVVTLVIMGVKKRLSFWPVAGMLGLFVSPLFLPIIMGKILVGRTQLTMPLACACLLIVCGRVLESLYEEKGKLRVQRLSVALCVILLYMQLLVVMRLYYTQNVIHEHDTVTTTQMVKEISDVGGDNLPLVFVGYLKPGYNASCYRYNEMGSYMCLSAYALRGDLSDEANTLGILAYYETLGFKYPAPSAEMIAAGQAESVVMPDWPAKGSVKNMGDYIVIRLSAKHEGFADQ